MQSGIRRRAPWWLLAVLFVVVPLLELVLLIRLGQVVGAWWTILILFAAAVLGSWLVKREGSRTWQALQEAIAAHRMPAAELADGALILVGGTLLITPGFISDLAGLFCILPFTRPAARGVLSRVITRRLTAVATPGGFGAPGGFSAQRGFSAQGDPGTQGRPSQDGPRTQDDAGTQRRPGHGDVIRGDVVDRD